MIFGFNTDVPGKDAVYHVQTEDRGVKNPVIDSIIYVGGEIVDRRQTPYVPQETNQPQIEAMVQNQHRQLVESIRSGAFAPPLPKAASDTATSGFTVRLLNGEEITREGQLCFEFSVWSRSQKVPAQNALLEVRWMSTSDAAQKLDVRTGGDGKAVACFPIPEAEREGTLLVCASGPEGREVVKYHVRGNLSTNSPTSL